ncbi:MAG: TIGR01458 family HAD-type hydrolase [Flavobacteriaceae bacterium]|nr:TIGR01458 family HAD-type hydrolase [Flavobacteriaceae bacterium]
MIKAFLFDLDGVFYVKNKLIDGANETIHWLKKNKVKYKFITNNTTLSRRKLAIKMKKIGLDVKEEEFISANYAGVLLIKKMGLKSCRLILSSEGMDDYLQFNITNFNPEAIIIGDIGDCWSYDLMNDLMNQILEGSKLIALHKGRYFQTNNGLTIDIGAFIAGLEHATETNSIVVGKPNSTFFEMAIQSFSCLSDEIAMIGDDLINDIQGGNNMGFKTFLVKTGKYRENIFKNSLINPDFCIKSIAVLPNFIEENNLMVK